MVDQSRGKLHGLTLCRRREWSNCTELVWNVVVSFGNSITARLCCIALPSLLVVRLNPSIVLYLIYWTIRYSQSILSDNSL